MLPLIYEIDSELERFFSDFYPQGKPYEFLEKWISGEKYEECRKYDYQLERTKNDHSKMGGLSYLNGTFKYFTEQVQDFLESLSSEEKVNKTDKDLHKSCILYTLEQLYEMYYNECIRAEFNEEDIKPSDIYNVIYVKYIEPLYDLINKYPFKVWA